MQIVIDIPEDTFFDLKKKQNRTEVDNAVLNGTPLDEQEPKYCDRNICIKNEYNGIGCNDCEVTKSQEPEIVHCILDETDNSITCGVCGCLIWANDISNGEAYFCPNCGCPY